MSEVDNTEERFDPNAARHSGLMRPPSKTIQRPTDTCRVVITVEVKVSQDAMKSLPRYKKDSTDYMREALAQYTRVAAVAEVLEEMRHDGEITVLSTKIEADK